MNEKKIILELDEFIVQIFTVSNCLSTHHPAQLAYDFGKIMGTLWNLKSKDIIDQFVLRELCQSIIRCKFVCDKLPKDLRNKVIVQSL